MPGQVTAARVFLFIFGGLITIGGFVPLTLLSTGETSHISALVAGLVLLAFGGLAIFTGVRFGKGGTGIRVLAIVLGSIYSFFGLGALTNSGAGVILLTGGVLIIVFTAGPQGSAWFNRPRHVK